MLWIVQKPYFVLRAKCSCWHCGQETPVVALGAKRVYLEEAEGEEWGNCCVHCGVMQEADGDYRYGCRSPFNPLSVEEARAVRVIYFNLPFDYYADAECSVGSLYDEMIR